MSEPTVTVQQGKIKGGIDTDLDGGEFYKFVGIPYAKPPIGPLRFKAPQPPETWTDIRDCSKDDGDPGCIAYERFMNVFMGAEDCLYLSVFTKELPTSGSKPKPVMVFIHGGGFTLGSGSMQGPKHLLTEDIILVTFSYRTGIFGFLSTDDASLDVPGNAGLKDQTLALKWVQENIAKFNGDANNVTIFGISAGGASVSFQILSPSAKGLFHKAIIQSGNALCPWAWGQKNAVQVAEKLGKTVSSEKEALDILKVVSAEELLKTCAQIPDVIGENNKRRPFGPVVEKPNTTAFLTENPFTLFGTGRYNQVPIIQGITSNEELISESPHIGAKNNITPKSGLIWYLGLEEDDKKSETIEKLVENFYFKNGITTDAIHKFVGDTDFLHGAIESTKLIQRTSAHPVYLYVYSHECTLSNLMMLFFGIRDETIRGVSHGGDQMVLFNSNFIKPPGGEVDEENREAVRQLVQIWVDFARTGRPHQSWKPVTNEEKLQYLDINKDLTLKINPFEERFAFWEKIFIDAPTIDMKLKEQPTE